MFSLSCCGVYRWFLSFPIFLLFVVSSSSQLHRLTRARWFSSPHSSRGRLVDIRFSCVVMLCRPIVPIAYVLSLRPGVGSDVEETDHHERRTVKVTGIILCWENIFEWTCAWMCLVSDIFSKGFKSNFNFSSNVNNLKGINTHLTHKKSQQTQIHKIKETSTCLNSNVFARDI